MGVPRDEARPDTLSDPLREGALEVLRTLRAAGHEALFAGGCVRDQVLGLTPKDWDIATSARPEEVLTLFLRCVPVGVAFGVVRVLVGAFEYEVATFRADGEYADHRRPTTVNWASAREDVLRRDFTINGLLQDPLADGEPIIDFVGGREDLERGVIRAIGDARRRFEEDYLRMLRAARFAARFGFAVEPETFTAIVAMSSRIVEVSGERIGQELDRLWSEGGQAVGFGLLARTGLLMHLLPEVCTPDVSLALGPAALRDGELGPGLERIQARLARLAGRGRCAPELGWATVLWDHAGSVEAVARRTRMSRAQAQAVTGIVGAGRALTGWPTLTVAVQKRLLRTATGPAAIEALELAGYEDAARAAREALTGWSREDLSPAPLITGQTLKARGHAPGPAFARALSAVEDAQLEGRVATRDEAIALAEAVIAGGAAP